MIHNRPRILILCCVIGLMISACNFNQPEATPTVEGVDPAPVDPLPEVDTPTLSLSPSPSHTPTDARIILESPTPSHTPLPPTITFTPTATPGPNQYTVQSGDTLGGIARAFGYGFEVIPRIVELNALRSETDIREGQVLQIPLRTPTPTPVGYELTLDARELLGINVPAQFSENTEIGCHTVVEGETIIGIATNYNTTIEVLSDINPEILFVSCDFNVLSGGEGCTVALNINQCVNVPLPTATPTLSPTPSGSETPTLTPTFAAPRALQPANGVIVIGLPDNALQWLSTAILAPDETYMVEVFNTVTGELDRKITRRNSLDLPDSLMPPSGESHLIRWTIAVARRNEQGTYGIISGTPQVYEFQWQNG